MTRVKTVLFMILLICLTSLGAFAVGQKMMSVQVRDGKVRSSPSFLGKIVASLSYGDRVVARSEQGDWTGITLPGSSRECWMHKSALSRKKIVLKPGAEDVEKAATSDELALAGKGFNKQVEGEFKSGNPDVDYTWVDRMEKTVISQSTMQQFLKKGGVTPGGGSE